MRYALVGYGRMGRAIEAVARDRGHDLAAIIDPQSDVAGVARSVEPGALKGAEVAFEFTEPSAAQANVAALLRAGVGVVCGTTGWDADHAEVRGAAAESAAGAVMAPNFSVGMNLFYRLVEEAARLSAAVRLYDPYVIETHHRGKLDAPSGTALRIASIVRQADPDQPAIQIGAPARGPVPPRAIHVTSVRAGHEPGSHTVGFDGEHDALRLTHRARGRGGFALGAVLAGEWIAGRRGLFGFDEVLKDLLEKGGRP